MLNNEDYLNIFHEIKNSVTLVNSSLQLLAKKHPEVYDFDYWSETMNEISFLKNMVTQLSSTRLGEHLNVTQINIYSYIHQISNTVRSLGWNNFTCKIFLDENLPAIELDPQLFKQAIVNIIKNAYEAMDCSGIATLHVSCENNFMRIAITDHGGGIDPTIVDTIFQPFITSKTGGSGLGLVITRQIIECHHGVLECTSRPGDGCTFTISLPLTQS